MKFQHLKEIVKKSHFGIKNIITHPDGTHIWSAILCTRVVLIFQGVLTKLIFLTKFPHLENIVNLMKDLKYEHQSIFFLVWEGQT